MSKENKQPESSSENIVDFVIPEMRRQPDAAWQSDVPGLDQELLEAPERQELLPESTTRELGSVGSAAANIEQAVAEDVEAETKPKMSEQELEGYLKTLIVSEETAVRRGYTESFPIEYRIFEPTDMPGFGYVKNRLAHVLNLDSDMVFVLKDGGHEPRIKPAASAE